MKLVFDISGRYTPLFTRAECCNSLFQRGCYAVARSFEGIVSQGVSGPRHISAARFRPKDVRRMPPDRDTVCMIPWTFIECEAGDLMDNLHATKTTLEILQIEGFNLLNCHVIFSGNKSFWIAIPSYLMGNPIGTVADQKALRQRVFMPLMEFPVDENLWDGRHLHRMIGSVHERGGRVRALAFRDVLDLSLKTEIRPTDPYRGWPCPVLYQLVREKAEFHVPPFRDVSREVESSVLDETEDGVAEGDRNYTAFRRACSLIRRMDAESALRELLSWNRRNDPPMNERELKNCLKSAIRTAQRKAA